MDELSEEADKAMMLAKKVGLEMSQLGHASMGAMLAYLAGAMIAAYPKDMRAKAMALHITSVTHQLAILTRDERKPN